MSIILYLLPQGMEEVTMHIRCRCWVSLRQ